jgi:hypothetical protein
VIARVRAAFVAASLVCAASAGAEIYRWTDASGRERFSMHLSDVPESQREAALEAAGAAGQSLSGYESKPRPTAPTPDGVGGFSSLPASHAVPAEPRIGGRTEVMWRRDAHEHIDAISRAEERLAACEAADSRKRMDSGLTALDACAAQEAAIDRAEESMVRFEDLARSKGVPPGWLR